MEATAKQAIETESYGSQGWIEQELVASKLSIPLIFRHPLTTTPWG